MTLWHWLVAAAGNLTLVEQRRLGRSGLRVSRLGLGTMTWGRDTDLHEAREQLEAFLEAGGTLVDTAAAQIESERVLGDLLAKIFSRDDIVIAAKAGAGDVSRKALLDQLDASLERMGVDTVDLWQVHSWRDDVPITETLSALEQAVTSGRARYVGVSNYAGWQTGYAAAYQAARDVPLVSTQVEYSLLARQAETEVLPAASACGLGVLAWSPLGRGVLTGKYRRGVPADSRAASAHFAAFIEPYLDERSQHVVDAVCTAADGLGATPLEVAVAWIRDQPGVTAPLIGARTAAQLREILPSEEIELPDEIRHALNDISTN